MLVNFSDESCEHVKFVSYTGKYPNLCSGLLTLEIDGEDVLFGYSYKAKELKSRTPDYEPFWISGGSIDWSSGATQSEWQIDFEEIPNRFKKYAKEIDRVFNENVEYGCCGGCL